MFLLDYSSEIIGTLVVMAIAWDVYCKMFRTNNVESVDLMATYTNAELGKRYLPTFGRRR